MVDKSALGAAGEPFEIVVENGKVFEFARAVRAAITSAPPPTFLTTQFFWEERVPGANPWARVAMSQERGMHAEQEYIFHGPPPAVGTRLIAQSRIAEIYEKQGVRGGTLTFAVMVTEFRDPGGRLVAEARMTGVEKERQSRVTREARRDPRLSGDWGLVPPPPRVIGPITRTDIVRYQGASGDLNPVHHDEPFARAAGYPAPLAVGMFQAGALFAWASDWLGADNVRRVRCRWREPVFPGDTLTLTGTVAREYQEAGETRVDLELTCTRQDGGVAVQGWATFAIGEPQ
jgi:acyl dehydratase